MKIYRDDLVLVIKGKDRGLSGKVLAVDTAKSKVIVAGINIIKRHVKKSNKYPEGGIIQNPGAIAVANVCLLDPKSKEKVKANFIVEGSKKSRVLNPVKKNGKSKASVKSTPKSEEDKK